MFSSHPIQFPKDHRHQRYNTLGEGFRLFTGMVRSRWEQMLWGSLKTSSYNVEKVAFRESSGGKEVCRPVLLVTEWSNRALL